MKKAIIAILLLILLASVIWKLIPQKPEPVIIITTPEINWMIGERMQEAQK